MLRTDSASSHSSSASFSEADSCWTSLARLFAPPAAAAQIEVDPASANLTDLVRLAHLAAPLSASAVLLADPAGLACWRQPRHVRLYFDEALAPTPPVASERTSLLTATGTSTRTDLACATLAQLLHTTRQQSPLANDKSSAARILRQYMHALGRSRRPQTATGFKQMVRIAGEALHREMTAQLPSVRAQVPQSPTDAMLHWISALRAARQTPAGASDTWLAQTEVAARRRWMQHDLTLPSVRSYFAQMQSECDAQGATGLALAAGKIAASLPDARQAQHFDTRLNDNLYGRVFETRLMAHLITSPAPGTLVCMQQLAATLLHFFGGLPPRLKLMVAKEVAHEVGIEPRFWFDQTPLLRRFITAESGEQKKSALANWLSTPPASGYDCMAIALFAGQLSLVLKKNASASAPWMWPASLNYGQVVQPSSRRLKNLSQPLLRPEGGILLLHQRPAFSHPTMRAGMRATLKHRPNLDSVSAVTRCALDHGLPYASGVSGSTNILLHQACFFRQNGIDIDIPHLLLAAVMLLNGGHSLHEVMWMAHQLDRPLGLGLGWSSEAPDDFVSDYDCLIDLFSDADRQAVEQAVAAAWDETIDYARLPID